jgi:hypothetical protein
MPSKKFQAILNEYKDTGGCFIELPFDPKEVFGKVRAPVKVTINGFTFRSTVFSMGGCFQVPFNKANRDGAGVAPGDKIKVQMELDSERRVVTVPDDLAAALKANKKASAAWDKLSYSHRREHVEAIAAAKRPETRVRRITKTIEMLENKAR